MTTQIKNNHFSHTTYIAINIDQDGPANYFMIGYNRQNNLPFMAYPCTYWQTLINQVNSYTLGEKIDRDHYYKPREKINKTK